jgi:penicillin-binding protein 2
MYTKRVKIFVWISAALLLVCVLRLAQMQLLADSRLRAEIAALREQRSLSRQLQTIRGRILDRKGRVLAADVPRFQICVDYGLARFLDDRVVEIMKKEAVAAAINPSLYDFYELVDNKRSDLEQIIDKCGAFGLSAVEAERRIRQMNDRIWDLRTFLAWARNGPDPNVIAEYGGLISVPLSVALADFEQQFPDPGRRQKLIAGVDDLPEMDQRQPLAELETEDDIFAAQVEFMDVNEVEILPQGHRYYPYGGVAAQTVGWVGPATQESDKELFEDDRLARYLQGEVCGREDGVEYVCEPILRGRRGELVIDIDGRLVRDTEADFGDDVTLTLDIELQRQIEEYLTDPQLNPNYAAPSAAVVVQIRSGDILALASVPTFDLNDARYNYGELLNDPNTPLFNRAINKQYPPGSSVKPFILVAALQEGLTTPDEVISCPARPAPSGWPNCLIWLRYQAGHDWRWENNARNAIKGSCNIYFSRMADRIDAPVLQRWLFAFGYGHAAPLRCPTSASGRGEPRGLRQAPGQISSTRVTAGEIQSLADVPPLRDPDKRLVGIGQGNLWATPLQVANAFATIARGGQHMPPRLFLTPRPTAVPEPLDLQLSTETLRVVYDGMDAVVNEQGGTAHKEFAPSLLSRQGVKVYGKTGSTERPYHAWFAGFAEDQEGAKVAVAVIVEGGQHGSSDAAPLARDIIQFCINEGYVGEPIAMPFVQPSPPDAR